jgi:predicted nucleic acid-binding protein
VGKEEDGPFRISMIGRFGGNWRGECRATEVTAARARRRWPGVDGNRNDPNLRGARAYTQTLLIAVTGLADDLTLLTPNRRHFARIPGLRITSSP